MATEKLKLCIHCLHYDAAGALCERPVTDGVGAVVISPVTGLAKRLGNAAIREREDRRADRCGITAQFFVERKRLAPTDDSK